MNLSVITSLKTSLVQGSQGINNPFERSTIPSLDLTYADVVDQKIVLFQRQSGHHLELETHADTPCAGSHLRQHTIIITTPASEAPSLSRERQTGHEQKINFTHSHGRSRHGLAQALESECCIYLKFTDFANLMPGELRAFNARKDKASAPLLHQSEQVGFSGKRTKQRHGLSALP